MTVSWPTIEWTWAPLVLLALTAVGIVMADLFMRAPRPALWMQLGLLGLLAAGTAVVLKIPDGVSAFNQAVRYDGLGRLGVLVILAGGCLIVLISHRPVRRDELPAAEYFALLLLVVLGLATLSISFELMAIFLSVEMVSVGVYILAGLRRGDTRGSEAAMKYFVLAAFSAGFLVLGFAFLYGGAEGSTLLGRIALAVHRPSTPFTVGCVLAGFALALTGFAFKLTLVPFHLYAADVFDGAPTPVAAVLAALSKAAGLIALIHLLSPLRIVSNETMQSALTQDFTGLLWIFAALSIVVGNAVALVQRRIKRMLAYSTIAHSGYLLIGVLVFLDNTVRMAEVETAILVYLIAYVLMNVGAFGVAAALGPAGEGEIEHYAGLARRSPALALAMTVALLSLTGIPATAGFVGKLTLFARAVEAGHIALVVLAVLGSAVSAYYYLRIVVYMYMRESSTETVGADTDAAPLELGHKIGLILSTAATVLFGVFPQTLLFLLKIL
ncbi:MAG: NADH-quinone oxidoreductase subunit N [Candidatus Sumerlaeia bacterium]|nr:NADH-quinone oxidoreductase subunit N [Candidatus Sumerlaeia bacterium]